MLLYDEDEESGTVSPMFSGKSDGYQAAPVPDFMSNLSAVQMLRHVSRYALTLRCSILF
jgi:hypothetical protein